LGSSGAVSKNLEAKAEPAAPVSVNKALLSIDYASKESAIFCFIRLTEFPENIETLDYLKEGDVGFKKFRVTVFSHCVCIHLIYIFIDKEKAAITQSC
jgi:hypothetical protein